MLSKHGKRSEGEAMSKRRRVFDIEMPDQEPETFPAGNVDEAATRRGPMASAIHETAESLRERQNLEARIRAENDALAHEHVRLKRLGLVMEEIPIDAIDCRKLARDRAKGQDEELVELIESIRAIGLSNPIRVEKAGEGRWELIQGFRRLAAYKALREETGNAEAFGKIPAVEMETGDTLDSLYRRMVDENLVRKDISFAEMAQLALDYAADPSTDENDPDKAVAILYRSAGYQKRSYIRSFIRLMESLGQSLRHAREIPRALGLGLVGVIDKDPTLASRIANELAELSPQSAQAELAVLRSAAREKPEEQVIMERPDPVAKARKSGGRAKTSFQFDRPEGRARCVAASGRLEVRLELDFSTVDRRKLERAVKRMLDEL